jgi:outer membrane lipoprotein SlyB
MKTQTKTAALILTISIAFSLAGCASTEAACDDACQTNKAYSNVDGSISELKDVFGK